MVWGTIEVEPEVEQWLEGLTSDGFGQAGFYIATGRRIILLTVFRKSRRRERREVERAWRAMQRCTEEGHTAED